MRNSKIIEERETTETEEPKETEHAEQDFRKITVLRDERGYSIIDINQLKSLEIKNLI